MKNIFPVLLFCFASFFSGAQSVNFYVTGKVLNAETKLPLQGASVFAENTTIGTATDADGNFKLQLPNGGYNLVVTFTGFSTGSKRVTTSDPNDNNMLFELHLREKEMTAVSVTANNEVKDGWDKYGNFFLQEFIGKTQNSAGCSIKNKEALKFYFSKRKNRLKVLATEPLLIENNALGYNIKYALDSFTHEYSTQVSVYTGYPLFEEMIPANADQKAKWDNARKEAYSGSIQHFMRSLFNRQLKEQGFEIQFLVDVVNKETAIRVKDPYTALHYEKDDSTQTVEILPNQLNVGIIYTKEKPAAGFLAENQNEPAAFQFSVLSFLPKQSIVIEQNGYYFEQNDLTIKAYWTWDKIADQLPYGYEATP